MKKEIWKSIPGYEGFYEASNLGRIRSLDRKVLIRDDFYRTYYGKILSPYIDKKGYYRCDLVIESKKRIRCKVHKLVAMAFHGHVPSGYKALVDHKNNISSDNRVENLRVTTVRDNVTKDIDKTKTTSKYTGVIWDKRTKRWQTKIDINKKTVHLGRYDNEEYAASLYKYALENLDKYDGDSNKFKELIKQQIPTTPEQ